MKTTEQVQACEALADLLRYNRAVQLAPVLHAAESAALAKGGHGIHGVVYIRNALNVSLGEAHKIWEMRHEYFEHAKEAGK